MTEQQRQASDQRIKRARETLIEAKILKDAHHFVGTVNHACIMLAFMP